MKDLWLVASYTFKDLVKRKSFIISNIIILTIMIIGFNIPNFINWINDDDESFGKTKLTIIDQNDVYEGSLKVLENLETNYEIKRNNCWHIYFKKTKRKI